MNVKKWQSVIAWMEMLRDTNFVMKWLEHQIFPENDRERRISTPLDDPLSKVQCFYLSSRIVQLNGNVLLRWVMLGQALEGLGSDKGFRSKGAQYLKKGNDHRSISRKQGSLGPNGFLRKSFLKDIFGARG